MTENDNIERVLGPGAVLHDVDTAGNLVSESTLGEPSTAETVPDLGVPAAAPTPAPVGEPHEDEDNDE